MKGCMAAITCHDESLTMYNVYSIPMMNDVLSISKVGKCEIANKIIGTQEALQTFFECEHAEESI